MPQTLKATITDATNSGLADVATKTLTINEQPQFSFTWYSDYPERKPVDPGTLQYFHGDGIIQTNTYILDVRVVNYPNGTAVGLIADVQLLPAPANNLVTITPLDTVTNSQGVCRFKIKFNSTPTGITFPSSPWGYNKDLYVQFVALTDQGQGVEKVPVLYCPDTTPANGKLSYQGGQAGDGYYYLKPGSWVEVALGGAGGGGSGSIFDFAQATDGGMGTSALIQINNRGPLVWDNLPNAMSAYASGLILLGYAAGGGGGYAQQHYGGGYQTDHGGRAQANLAPPSLVIDHTLFRLECEVLDNRIGADGWAADWRQWGGDSQYNDPTTGTVCGKGGGGGDISGSNRWGYGGGGASGGYLRMRIYYRRKAAAAGYALPPAPIVGTPQASLSGALGGTGAYNGGNGGRGVAQILASGNI